MNYKVILITLLSVFALAGCVRKESPIWYMTSSDDEINSHFQKICLDYGYKNNTPEFNRCVRQERQASSSKANDKLYQAGQAMERAGTPLMYRSQDSNDCRYNPATKRYQICLRKGAFGCATFGRNC